MSLTDSQKAYFHSKMDLTSELPSLYQSVGGWDLVAERCRPGLPRAAEAEAAIKDLLAKAHGQQAAALVYLEESGADEETRNSLGDAESCFREVGRLIQQIRRCTFMSKRWQELNKQYAAAENRGNAARDKYSLWVMIQTHQQA